MIFYGILNKNNGENLLEDLLVFVNYYLPGRRDTIEDPKRRQKAENKYYITPGYFSQNFIIIYIQRI